MEFVSVDAEREEWLCGFRGVLCDAGLSQMKAMSVQMNKYGKGGIKADLSACPCCCAEQWLLSRGMIPKAR